jgi:hypothetical protein
LALQEKGCIPRSLFIPKNFHFNQAFSTALVQTFSLSGNIRLTATRHFFSASVTSTYSQFIVSALDRPNHHHTIR